MEITLDLLEKRHSVRSYKTCQLSEKTVNALRSEVTYINTHEAGLNFQLCFNDSSPFKGFTRSYGMFRNVSNYLVAVIDPTFANASERAGYYAQQFVMECVGKDLGTCFVGGTFSRDHMNARVEVYEKVPFVVAFGQSDSSKTSLISKISAGLAHRKRRDFRDFYDGDDTEYASACKHFGWLDKALKAVACAPSALNKQPVRLKMIESAEGPAIVAYTVNPEKNSVDLGIAKFNVASVVPGVWDWGEKGAFYPDCL